MPAEPPEQGVTPARKIRGGRRTLQEPRARAAAPRVVPAPSPWPEGSLGSRAGSRGEGREPGAQPPRLIHQPDEEQRRALGPLFAFSPIIAAPQPLC